MRLYEPRWKHIKTFYLIELSRDNYYQAQSLTHHPHYSILRSEFPDFETALLKFQSQHRSCQIKCIKSTENFKDEFLIVINHFQPYSKILDYVQQIDDSYLIPEVLSRAKLDKNRGNVKMDFGFSCGQNLQRDPDQFGVTRPRVLDQTKEPVFLDIQKQLSQLSDLVSDQFNLAFYHQEEDIHLEFAQKLHPEGIIPSWRAAGQGPNQFLEVHEDANNDSRPLMSPVGVLSRIYQTQGGPLRLTKIGYSRQSLYDAKRREREIKPIVAAFKQWENTQPNHLKTVSSDLFDLQPNSCIPGVIEIPCHLERSVGVSPYIDATIKTQKLLQLSRHHCVAMLYNCVTNESPYYFRTVYQRITCMGEDERSKLSKMSPMEFGLWYHTEIWQAI